MTIMMATTTTLIDYGDRDVTLMRLMMIMMTTTPLYLLLKEEGEYENKDDKNCYVVSGVGRCSNG